MHCERCNIDFSEGLHYCKWCGDPLVDRARITSELHSCPSCSAAVQPGWAFCKSCGERLRAPASKPAPVGAEQQRQPGDTPVASVCSSCGERLDTGSLYCKACGSAAYAEQRPFGGSAMLCGACNSYSPFGSRVCRVCGAALSAAPQTVVDRPAPQAPLTPDDGSNLGQQFVTEEIGAVEQHIVDSGASTIAFIGSEHSSTSRPSRAADTTTLPGTAGSHSEQQALTSVVQMGRITGPVEDEPVAASSGDLAEASPRADQADKPITTGFGSEPEVSQEEIGGATQVIASPLTQPPSSREDIRTREFVPPQRAEITREVEVPRTEVATHAPTVEDQIGKALPASEAGGPATGKRKGVIVASIAVAAIVIAAAVYVVWWLVFSRSRPTPTPPSVVQQPVAPTQPAAPPTSPTLAPPPEGMVAVAAGSYTIGRDKADPLEQPEHKVDLPAFYIDRTEVTNEAYKKFVDATGHVPPTNWSAGSFPEGRDNFPVTGVTWQDAADYAAWAKKRLPTEAEWEAAARGTEARLYPWGNDWREGIANIGAKADEATNSQYPSGLMEVGRFPTGASPTGAVDMIGNAWEWTADEFALYPGNSKAVPKEIKEQMKPGLTYRIIRGGAYDGNKKHDATYRGLLDGSDSYPKVGFRCVKDARQ